MQITNTMEAATLKIATVGSPSFIDSFTPGEHHN